MKTPKPNPAKRRRPEALPPATAVVPSGLWRSAERHIYQYDDGRQLRQGDPLELWAGLLRAPDVDWDGDLRLIFAEFPEGQPVDPQLSRASADTLLRVTAAIRAAFDLPPASAGGLTMAECLELRGHFVTWMNACKKKASPSPTSSAPTPAWGAPSSPVASPIPSTSGSPSTSPAPCSGPPTSLPPASAAP